jgi:hypothetical protein
VYVFSPLQPQILLWAIRKSSANLTSRQPGQRAAQTYESQELESAVRLVPLMVRTYAQEAWGEQAMWVPMQEEPAARMCATGQMTMLRLLVNWQAAQKQRYF